MSKQEEDEIARGWVYRIFYWLFCTYAEVVHDISVEGEENIKEGEAVLLVSFHTSHNVDILISLFLMRKTLGRVPRALFHRPMMMFWGPLLRRFGGVSGTRKRADAYELYWLSHNSGKRLGYARVAEEMGAGSKVIPYFCENAEEMKWNPLFDLWSFLLLDRLYGAVMRSMPGPIHFLMWQFAILCWFSLSFFSLPVPVKVIAHIGEPVVLQKGERAEQFAERVERALQELMVKKQNGTRRNYWKGLKQRMEWRKKLE
ncbi:hypothetical protein GUITHDRAFT_138890 [Guillardia theta CCMP2712]|uniref:Phospholipid/glycerol acyltransferase domain-containing protein n=1 Tax=Guillardia theta (strain CCMP2712) TaxID=905079 RepID=L1JBJ7_GUITC|nr:hypothetical protein GUITHDRAFT_138890 [Guillardia theta CCMP2712]EKX45687.1 hypothetical protein GUITHDRAFT_138890 [Guillardia theta CCMP2712]|eukprot:XP_005832667.1 hypothetical protein GUITHDRAFT_138890 [Guillardia theta CCMP2712]